jgi:hypothetical protein
MEIWLAVTRLIYIWNIPDSHLGKTLAALK